MGRVVRWIDRGGVPCLNTLLGSRAGVPTKTSSADTKTYVRVEVIGARFAEGVLTGI
jgi:hypothetical protein